MTRDEEILKESALCEGGRARRAAAGGIAAALLLSGGGGKHVYDPYTRARNAEIVSGRDIDGRPDGPFGEPAPADNTTFALNRLGVEHGRRNDAAERRELERERIIGDIWEYMEESAARAGLNPYLIEITPEYILDLVEHTGFDLPLLLAQARQESCFGLTNRAKRTNSVFSMGSFDDGRDTCTFDTQDESVDYYIERMLSDYLSSSTVGQLLRKFVNYRGDRYASDPHYEDKIRSIRKSVLERYPEMKKFTIK